MMQAFPYRPAIVLLLLVPLGAFCRDVTWETPSAWVRVSPGIGRISGWGASPGRDLLWMKSENPRGPGIAVWEGYRNYGGDKLWLLPEKLRPFAYDSFVPSPETDRRRWAFHSDGPFSGKLVSPSAHIPGVRMVRSLELDPKKPVLTIWNEIRKQSASPFPLHLWSVTQIRLPVYFLLEARGEYFPEVRRYFRYRGKESRAQIVEWESVLRVEMPRENFDYDKIYAFGQFIAAVYPDVVFVQWMDSPEGGAFSDGGNLQVYANPAYAELEIASPLRLLQPGQTMKTVFSEFSLPQP